MDLTASTRSEMDALPGSGLPDVSPVVSDFMAALKQAGFSGDLASDPGNRIACSTDNSIYQVFPQAVIYPREGRDLTRVMQVANRSEFRDLKLYPRGGGTSTNGQSLGPGVVVDTSRHLRRILSYDADNGLVRVEPGLVRDALIDFLKPYGRFLAPHVSTTSRATLGGMVSNDSSGKGSLVYGRTSDHIETIEFILPNGEEVELGCTARQDLPGLYGVAGDIARRVDQLLTPHFDAIQDRFPKTVRGFTGYNLKEARTETGALNLAKLVAGSEGTLGLIKSVTLRAEPIPRHTVLVALVYPGRDACLRAVPGLLDFHPVAIEFIDDKILGAALRSSFAEDVRAVLGMNSISTGQAALFFEMSDHDADRLDQRLAALVDGLHNMSPAPTSHRMVRSADQIAQIWEVRRACQGLIAGFDQNRRAVAFIEDSAVPPEHLADFVADLEKILDSRNIPLGMYGHADVGCVHIRPLMNLTAADERRQIREISDAVFQLTRKYGGLLWGEHGKGLRGEYSEDVIGADLFNVMRQVKSLFDPENRMNPGKIARPEESALPLIALDGVRMRGEFDAQVSPNFSSEFSNALRCDGNGACFNLDEKVPICPSYKATSDRRMSPKGRAGLLREWLRARSAGDDAATQTIAEELNDVLDTCLGCKACAGEGCSAAVDIPGMKARFLHWYYGTRRRPLADYLVANLERLAPMLDRLVGGLSNRLLSTTAGTLVMLRFFGLVDLPRLRNRADYLRQLKTLGVQTRSVKELLQLSEADRARSVVVVQDCFTTYYDPDVVLAQLALIQNLGFSPVLLSYREGGKPKHVRGFMAGFKRVAARNARDLAALHGAGFTLVGVDGATTLMYRHEYPDALPDCPEFSVQVLGEWLASVDLPTCGTDQTYVMIQHCTERSLTPKASGQWAEIFQRAGISVRLVKAGCCGMSGLFGHEKAHQAISAKLFDQNWRSLVEADTQAGIIATGYSCRSQVKRFSRTRALHPAQVILRHWGG